MALSRNSVQGWAHLTVRGSELGSPKDTELARGSSSPVVPASEDGDRESRIKLPRETSQSVSSGFDVQKRKSDQGTPQYQL